MDKLLQPFEAPPVPLLVERVPTLRPLLWLGRGMSDMHGNPCASLPYGVFFAVLGYLILSLSAQRTPFFSAAVSGFMLIGPLAAAGCYEISRQQEQGVRCSFLDSLHGLTRNANVLIYYGVFLAVSLISWERLSSALFSAYFHAEVPHRMVFVQRVFRLTHAPDFVLIYLGAGAVVALGLYCLSVVSVPLMMDRGTNILSAMATSLRVVYRNPGALALWAMLIVALVLVGFATYLVGLIITLPMVGHATWHAYRDLVREGLPTG